MKKKYYSNHTPAGAISLGLCASPLNFCSCATKPESPYIKDERQSCGDLDLSITASTPSFCNTFNVPPDYLNSVKSSKTHTNTLISGTQEDNSVTGKENMLNNMHMLTESYQDGFKAKSSPSFSGATSVANCYTPEQILRNSARTFKNIPSIIRKRYYKEVG